MQRVIVKKTKHFWNILIQSLIRTIFWFRYCHGRTKNQRLISFLHKLHFLQRSTHGASESGKSWNRVPYCYIIVTDELLLCSVYLWESGVCSITTMSRGFHCFISFLIQTGAMLVVRLKYASSPRVFSTITTSRFSCICSALAPAEFYIAISYDCNLALFQFHYYSVRLHFL